jgi:putative flippase GtrA
MRSPQRVELVRQFGRFVLVGAGNTVLSLVVYALLAAVGLRAAAAGAAAFSAGAVNGYLWNRRWTFHAPDSAAAKMRYVVVQLGGVAGTSLLAWSLATAGYLAAIPLVTGATFIANRCWTFARSQAPSSEPYALR